MTSAADFGACQARALSSARGGAAGTARGS